MALKKSAGRGQVARSHLAGIQQPSPNFYLHSVQMGFRDRTLQHSLVRCGPDAQRPGCEVQVGGWSDVYSVRNI